MNNLDDSIVEVLNDLFKRSPDEFGITLSGNSIDPDLMKDTHKRIELMHK